MLKKIERLLKSKNRADIELAFRLSLSSGISLWPIERDLKDIFYHADLYPNYSADNIPLGQLCLAVQQIIKIKFHQKDIKLIPERIDYFESLNALSITGCPVRELPKSLNNLEALKYLTLSKTNIKSIDDILDQSNIESLILIDNKTLQIEPESIYRSKLKKISVCKATANYLSLDESKIALKII